MCYVLSQVHIYLSLTTLLHASSVTSFVAVAKEVKQKLEDQSWAGQLLTGEVVAHKRQQMVDEFQEGVTPVFVCTYGERIKHIFHSI